MVNILPCPAPLSHDNEAGGSNHDGGENHKTTTTQQTPPKSGAPLGSGQRGGGHNNTTTRDVEPTRHRGFELFCHFILIIFFDPLESEAPNHSLNKISGQFSVSCGKYSSMSYAANSFASLASISGSGTINCSVAGSFWIL